MIESGVVDATQEAAVDWLVARRRFAQALLVDIEGSAPLPAGAMMVIDEDGAVEGSLTGGCVESAVVQEAEELLCERRDPGVLTYGISDELAGTVGLTCGGIVHIFLDAPRGEAADVELRALCAHNDGRPVAIATALDGDAVGSRIALIGDEVIGSLNGPGLLDRNVVREAQGMLAEGKTALRRFGVDGATLGAERPVHIRAYALPPRMFIVGAIDFSAALAPMAAQVGYQVTIVDARDRFARSHRYSAAAEVRIGWPQETMRGLDLGARDVVLVFTHDPKFDEPALLAALGTEAGYIGALGSRRTTRDRNQRLSALGVSDRQLARVHAPCGLDIGSRTAEETAVSVLAEIIATRAQRDARPLRDGGGPIHTPDLR